MPIDPTNIRSDDPSNFQAQGWLIEKVNKNNVQLLPSNSMLKPTAEWANAVDESFREVNEAFNGLPVNASNVGGLVRVARAEVADAGGIATIPVLSELPENTMIAVEVTTYMVPPANVTGGYGILHTYALARTAAAGTAPQIIPLTDDILASDGIFSGMSGELLGTTGPETLDFAADTNGAPAGTRCYFDVSIRSFPEPLNLPSAIQP